MLGGCLGDVLSKSPLNSLLQRNMFCPNGRHSFSWSSDRARYGFGTSDLNFPSELMYRTDSVDQPADCTCQLKARLPLESNWMVQHHL